MKAKLEKPNFFYKKQKEKASNFALLKLYIRLAPQVGFEPEMYLLFLFHLTYHNLFLCPNRVHQYAFFFDSVTKVSKTEVAFLRLSLVAWE